MEIAFLPQSFLIRLSDDARTRLMLNYAMSGTLIILVCAMFGNAPVFGEIPHVCLMQWLLSVPCPGCGITTSLLAVAHQHVGVAWRANPAGPVLSLHLVLQAILGTVGTFSSRRQQAALVMLRTSSRVALAIVLFVWVFRIL